MAGLAEAQPAPKVLIGPRSESLAERLLLNAAVTAELLPFGLNGAEPFELLLVIFAAEARANYYAAGDLAAPSSVSRPVTARWVQALLDANLIEQRDQLVALTPEGHDLVERVLERMFAAQQGYA